MPQMAPMNWLTLFFMFLMVYMMFNTLNYFMFLYTPQNKIYLKLKKQINWKW
uniref:ATP synthase F0 subunit 8 n=1 Tax=Anotylus gibbulus TaxID=2992775 RepID=UPI002A8079B7|nr:ATP synthase F0 subunit 8 [Anotylus gibbulus]UZA61056.1 ATP synthase F0 subunit 8 [Anotylus gibbulus]